MESRGFMESKVDELVNTVGSVVLGKVPQIRLALTCLLSGGHLLIEDQPGMGKTTLAQALSRVLGLAFNRVQFTSDLLPADVLGVSVYNPQNRAFEFHAGPVFTQVLLADEINRSTPKTQSALLEAMEEGQVTLEGETRPLPKPFFVIATQNPQNQSGTFPLPESQLDRFLMRISLGYPDKAAERRLLERQKTAAVDELPCLLTPEELDTMMRLHEQVKVSKSVLDYVQRLVQYTRTAPEFTCGVSTRGVLALMQCARTWAWIHGRNHVVPEDLQTLLPSVMAHRVKDAADYAGQSGYGLVARTLESVDVIG